ncbi:MAG: tetraacyldisaccharide 4'-kinase, partial [Bacteroidales bacterium]|nr:tetraacyldisaccharide 4'-kinase [Bacteroidales bacterium]
MKWLLWFPSKLFQFGVWIRTLLYDKSLISTYSADVPTIVVGNIAVGGTGKTPHVEYLIDLLHSHYQLVVLSRGYKRHTKGFVLAEHNNQLVNAQIIGDEPFQLFTKYADVPIAVDKNRVEGIKNVVSQLPKTQVVVLDDAFQYRPLQPRLSIVLCDSNHLPVNDNMLPLGRLREPLSALHRADVVVITKCDTHLTEEQMLEIRKTLKLSPRQQLFSSIIQYGDLKNRYCESMSISTLQHRSVLLVTGIANPKPLCRYLKDSEIVFYHMAFPDHHDFSKADIESIVRYCDRNKDAVIITTEKDNSKLE